MKVVVDAIRDGLDWMDVLVTDSAVHITYLSSVTPTCFLGAQCANLVWWCGTVVLMVEEEEHTH